MKRLKKWLVTVGLLLAALCVSCAGATQSSSPSNSDGGLSSNKGSYSDGGSSSGGGSYSDDDSSSSTYDGGEFDADGGFTTPDIPNIGD